MTHLLALKAGEVIAKGPLADTLSSALLTECFSWPLELIEREDGRFSAQSAKPAP